MKKTLLLNLILLTSAISNTYAQYLKIDNGIGISSFNNSKRLPILNNYTTKYNFALGMDYMERDWYSFSSQIGYMQIGGKEKNDLLQENYKKINETKGFLNVNTTFRGFIKSGNTKYFLGIGPYMNVLISNSKFKNELYDNYDYKTLHPGIQGEVGLTQDINNFRFGFIGSYMRNLTPTASTSFLNLGNNVFNAKISIGYKI